MSKALAITLTGINALLTLFYFGLIWVFFEALHDLFEVLYLLPLFEIFFFWIDFFLYIALFYVVMSLIPIVTLSFRSLHVFSVVWLYVLAAINLGIGAIVNGVLLLVVALLLMRRKELYLGGNTLGTTAPIGIEQHSDLKDEAASLPQKSPIVKEIHAREAIKGAKDKIDHYPMHIILPAIGIGLTFIDFLFSVLLAAGNFSERVDQQEIINRFVAQFSSMFVSGAGLILFLRNQLNGTAVLLWYLSGGLLLFSSNYLTGAIIIVSALLLQLDQRKFRTENVLTEEG